LSSLVLTTRCSRRRLTLTQGWMPIAPGCLRGADLVAGLALITVLFALLFKVLPMCGCVGGKSGAGSRDSGPSSASGGPHTRSIWASAISSTYGAAGSLVALLIWIYYSCAILFYGAEYIRAHRLDDGLQVEPKETAVLVRRESSKNVSTMRILIQVVVAGSAHRRRSGCR